MNERWINFGNTIDNAFFFVVDIIISLQTFFLGQAMSIGRVVLLIAILSAAITYALTGSGLKENIIKILKATVFFFVIIFAFPNIIGFISSWTFDLAYRSIYPSVSAHFDETVERVETISQRRRVPTGDGVTTSVRTFTDEIFRQVPRDERGLFRNLVVRRSTPQMDYAVVSPASVLQIVFMMSGQAFNFANDENRRRVIPEMSRILIGLIIGFFLIFIGVFALLEYITAFLEFMLVASVGVILFPLTMWEGSKFMAEKYVGAIVGFFIKLLFCNIAIFVMIYGFVSMFYITEENGFSGGADQILFIVFSGLLFLLICKSAPAVAQGLLTGTPSLSAAGAFSAVGGAVAAAAGTVQLARAAGKSVGGTIAGGTAKAAFGAAGALAQAGSAARAAGELGGGRLGMAGAFMGSIGSSAGNAIAAGAGSMTRSLLGRGGGGSGGSGYDQNSQFGRFLNTRNEDGSSMGFSQYVNSRADAGTNSGIDYMVNREAQRNTQES